MVQINKTPPAMPNLDPHQVVIRPLITEKGTHLVERHNAYTFKVHATATKEQIKKAIEVLFDVAVDDVRTQTRKGKQRRFKGRIGQMAGWKKAIVKLKGDDRIAFF